MQEWLQKNPNRCPICRKQYKQKKKVNYKLKQAIEEIQLQCGFCSASFNYGDIATHRSVCPGLNYTCPNEGCGLNKNLLSEDDLRKHFFKDCKFTMSACKNCELLSSLSEKHDCVIALKQALALSKKQNLELQQEIEKLKIQPKPA
jgi:hypothetical protein